uniref:Toll/interleukin-1 receptor (TIR) domain-containing protein n=1 Tax=Tanacetum cinerariifolium TaxID=118510 RepID=A0A699I131_TANCI|nr:Toll/interleukin-1 receptor (TIR) domain-containing protein [Tanacetum cinerariifolium]
MNVFSVMKRKAPTEFVNIRLPQLKVLRLHNLERLVSTPDFNGLPNLQKLELIQCYELKEIHPSLGNHRSLKSVHVLFCYKLRMFPTIVRMEQLESLRISHCDESLVFPEIQSNMKCLVKLDLHHIQIDALLSSIGERCTNLIYLRLFYCFSLNSTQVEFDGLKCLKEFIWSKGHRKTPFPLPLTRSLRKLDLSKCYFEDGEIPSDIGELSNLQDLDLSDNNFSKLHFSLSQLTRLKLLNLSRCYSHVKLPEVPSSIAIFIADRCDKLTSIDDLSENCKSLCYISLEESTVIDGNRLVQSMLKGNAIENQSMHLRVKGLEIPKQFTKRLYAGDECWLPLPENWCNDFCGFLICAVLEPRFYSSTSPGITIKEEASDDMRGMFHDVVWGKSFGGKLTWVWYVPFASLRCTEWWNPTHKNVSFYFHHYNTKPSNYLGIGASLVPMNNGSGLTDSSIDSFEFTDDYTPNFSIHYDSKSPDITIKEEASDDMRGMFHDVVWGESFGGKLTWVWYVSFASLRRTEWWNPTHKNVSFYFDRNDRISSIGIGASLVSMNNGSGPTDTSTDSSEFTDDYTPKIMIRHDSKSSLTISPCVYSYF